MSKTHIQLKIANTIHELRTDKKMSQDQLAQGIGVTRATINSIEKGNYNPSLELAFKIARFFKKDINKVFIVEEK